MGGFTSAAPILVGRKMGAATFLHESNAVPGRANRLLSRWADEVLVGMAPAAERFGNSHVEVTGTPVRDDFRELDQRPSREALGTSAGSTDGAGDWRQSRRAWGKPADHGRVL